jgi:exodeoxyribonuclease VII large subunit
VTSIQEHRSGHVYLTLADESSSLDACVWKGRVPRCRPLPTQGDLVQAHYERVNFYGPRGATKLLLDRMRPTGDGELLRRRAETLRRLQAEGLCDPERRKSLPAFPRRVGVIAARNDASVDVIQALRRRFPPQDIVFCPVAVQGVHAVGSVIDGLGRLQATNGVDVIVIARGGGSPADLLAFDDERLCRAIYACAVPVITSIGHTKDRPNCDWVAAAFAPVPAKAAELAIGHSAEELLDALNRQREALVGQTSSRLQASRGGLIQVWAGVRPSRELEALTEDIQRQMQFASSKLHVALIRRDAAFVKTDQALASTMRRVPLQSNLGDMRARLVRAAVAYLARHDSALGRSSRKLEDSVRRIPGANSLDVMCAHLESARMRTEDKQGDLLAALRRRIREAEENLVRRCEAGHKEVRALDDRLRPIADRVLEKRLERVNSLLAILLAKDFRRHGWTMTTDENKEPVRSVEQLRVSQTLTLHLADGEATATVSHYSKETGDG